MFSLFFRLESRGKILYIILTLRLFEKLRCISIYANWLIGSTVTHSMQLWFKMIKSAVFPILVSRIEPFGEIPC